MKTSVLTTALFTFAGSAAFAHSELTHSSPADHASLDAPPKELTLHFSEPVRLTAVAVAHAGDADRNLSPLPSERKKDFTLASPGLEKGAFTVTWRAMSEDAHVMKGDIHFTVAVPAAHADHDAGPAGQSTQGEHDTHTEHDASHQPSK